MKEILEIKDLSYYYKDGSNTRVIFDKFKKIKSFNIVDLIVKENINTYLIGGILLFIISSLIVYVLFKNKERIISMLEKGDNEYED